MYTTLKQYLDTHPELAGFINMGSQAMMLFCRANGEILWANESFLEWIGYNLDEFTRKDNPITWKDISVRDTSLDADIHSIMKLQEGKIMHYMVRKFYVPKHGSPHFVELFVRRYPPAGKEDMVLAVVEVTVLHNTHARMALAYEDMVLDIRNSLKALTETNEGLYAKLDNQLTSGLNGCVIWLTKHPLIGLPVAGLLILLLFGERAMEVLHKFMSLGVK
jgi:PAS domain S-box-containing protein